MGTSAVEMKKIKEDTEGKKVSERRENRRKWTINGG